MEMEEVKEAVKKIPSFTKGMVNGVHLAIELNKDIFKIGKMLGVYRAYVAIYGMAASIEACDLIEMEEKDIDNISLELSLKHKVI